MTDGLRIRMLSISDSKMENSSYRSRSMTREARYRSNLRFFQRTKRPTPGCERVCACAGSDRPLRAKSGHSLASDFVARRVRPDRKAHRSETKSASSLRGQLCSSAARRELPFFLSKLARVEKCDYGSPRKSIRFTKEAFEVMPCL